MKGQNNKPWASVNFSGPRRWFGEWRHLLQCGQEGFARLGWWVEISRCLA